MSETDIVEHLGRFVATRGKEHDATGGRIVRVASLQHGDVLLCVADLERAASEITRLRAENAELMEAVTRIRDATNADDPESYRADDREGCLDTVFAIAARAILTHSRDKE